MIELEQVWKNTFADTLPYTVDENGIDVTIPHGCHMSLYDLRLFDIREYLGKDIDVKLYLGEEDTIHLFLSVTKSEKIKDKRKKSIIDEEVAEDTLKNEEVSENGKN